jgi:hypothetical protein
MSPSSVPSPAPSAASHAERQFSSFVAANDFPCVGAKSALHRNRMRFGSFGRLGDPDSAQGLVDALKAFSVEFEHPGASPVSFIAMFDPMDLDEARFEQLLWQQLQSVHDQDHARGSGWDDTVANDPASDQFSFSIGARAFFVVGLHPAASRLARRAPFPCLVFNFHDQFVNLKASGTYGRMQTVIRARDTALQGSVNPVLARFGESSEARQYSGRAVEEAWQCPFHAKEPRRA